MKVFLRISSVLGIIAALIGGYFLLMEETTIGLILTLGGLYIAAFPEDIFYLIFLGIAVLLYDILGLSMESTANIIFCLLALLLIIVFCHALSKKFKANK